MIGGEFMMRLFRSVFREQKTRLRIDWLTHTDELIMKHLEEVDADSPDAIADQIDRSVEYVSDRCRQLALRGLLEETEPRRGTRAEYRIAELGSRYLADEVDASELEKFADI